MKETIEREAAAMAEAGVEAMIDTTVRIKMIVGSVGLGVLAQMTNEESEATIMTSVTVAP